LDLFGFFPHYIGKFPHSIFLKLLILHRTLDLIGFFLSTRREIYVFLIMTIKGSPLFFTVNAAKVSAFIFCQWDSHENSMNYRGWTHHLILLKKISMLYSTRIHRYESSW